MVVTDTNGEDIYVVMGLEQYENLVDPQDFDEDDHLDDICRHDDEDDWGKGWWEGGPPPEDIDPSSDGLGGAVAESFSKPLPTDFSPVRTGTGPEPDATKVAMNDVPPTDIWEAMQPAGQEGETWDLNKMSEPEKADLVRQFEDYQAGKDEEKVEDGNSKIEEVKEEKKEDEDFGEEQFYLEPIE